MICLLVGDLENMVDWLHICCIGDLVAVVGGWVGGRNIGRCSQHLY